MRPPLGVMVEVSVAGGRRFQWGLDPDDAATIPRGVGWSTRIGDGFSEGGCALARPIDRDYPDVSLLGDLAVIGYDGSVGYEGRVAAIPRSIGDEAHSVEVQAAGHMAVSRDHKAQVIFVDRDFGHWGGPGAQRQKNLIVGGFMPDKTASVVPDDSSAPALTCAFSGEWNSAVVHPDCEAWYDSRGIGIGGVEYAWARSSTIDYTDTGWTWDVLLSTDDLLTVKDDSGNLRSSGPGGYWLDASGAQKDYACVQLWYNGAGNGYAGSAYQLWWTVLAVFGTHGLPRYGQLTYSDARGLLVSDMVRWVVENHCPQLDPSGIEATTYAVKHAAYLDPTDPFDIITDLNKYHRWNFGVEEGRRFFFRPVDLTDYDWQVGAAEPGVTVDLHGPSVEGGALNGMCVNFTNLATGRPGRLTPLTNPAELAETDPSNPANAYGYTRWGEISLSYPAPPGDAAQVGRMALAERNAPAGEGSIRIRGHVRDRAGHWQQAWKVRAGDRISITGSASLSDRPRRITETRWDQDSLTLAVSVDNTPQLVDAYFDRVTTALAAANLA